MTQTPIDLHEASRDSSDRRHRLKFIGLLALLAIIDLVGNARMALFDRDEAWYAQISRTMVQSGDWVVPRFRGEVFDGKPVFAFWCQAISMKLFGQTVFAARLPSVIFCLATLAILGLVVARFKGWAFANWMTLVLGASALFIGVSKLALTDAELLLWITLAQLCLAAIYLRACGTWLRIALWIFVGLAAMTKGPVVFGMVGGTVIALAIFDILRARFSGKTFSLHTIRTKIAWWWNTRPILGIFIVLAVLLPWAILVAHRAPDFIKQTMAHNMLGPIFGKPLNGRAVMPGFYLIAIWPCFLPWSLLIPAAIFNAYQRRGSPTIRFCLAASIGPLIVIEMVKQKLPHYLLPLFPPLAFLVADVIVRTLDGRSRELAGRGIKFVGIALALLLILTGAAPWIFMRPQFEISNLPYIAMAMLTLTGLVLGLALAWLWLRGRFAPAFIVMGSGTLLIAVIIFGGILPQFMPLRGSRAASLAMWNDGFNLKQSVALYGYAEPSITYYLDGAGKVYPKNYFRDEKVMNWPRWLICSSETLDELGQNAVKHYQIIGRYRAFSTGSRKASGWIVVMKEKQPDFIH